MLEEEEKLILDNQGLIRFVISQLGYSLQDDDLMSIGQIGLIKAARGFDKSKNIKFATYAIPCIRNEILMYFRKENKRMRDISLESSIQTDKEGNQLLLKDIIVAEEDSVQKWIQEQEEKDTIVNVLNAVLNVLKPKQAVVALYRISGKSQREIADIVNISQSYVSRLCKRISKELFPYQSKCPSQKVFSIKIVGAFYQVRFSLTNINQFSLNFAVIVMELTKKGILREFMIQANQEYVTLRIPATIDAFVVLAQIMQLVKQDDEKNKTLTSNSNTNSVKKKMSNSKTIYIREKAKEIRRYIFSLESFTLQELNKQFPDAPTPYTIRNIVQSLKNEGKVVSIARGSYRVQKPKV